MHLLSGGHHVGEVPDNGIALALGDADDLSDESGVEEQRVPTSNRVRSNERVRSGDGITADWPANGSRVVGLHIRRVQGGQALEIGLHVRRKNVIRSVL